MEFLEVVKIILLGVIEGITEWLPVSSTGHMYLFDSFFSLNVGANSEAFKEMFMVVIQLGAILAVVVLFFSKLWPLAVKKEGEGTDDPDHLGKGKVYAKKSTLVLWLKVIVACLPSVVFGLLLDDFLEEHLYNGVVIAIALIVYGVAFIVIENINKKRVIKVENVLAIDYKTALLIGLFQVLAMIPGTSRSGATIIGALLIGVNRTSAAEFTFFLAIPTMFGASLLKIVKFLLNENTFGGVEILALVLGMVVAFVVSMFVIRFLMDFVKKHDFKIFGYYRIALGVVVLAVFIAVLFA